MTNISDLSEQYDALDKGLPLKGEEAIDASCLLSFQYEHADQPAEMTMDSDEFTALCPWTGVPDFGTLTIKYVPNDRIIELKSLKSYLLSFRDVGIVQEHVAGRVLKDLVALCGPRYMEIVLDYKVRGGIHTVVRAHHGFQGPE